MPAKQLVVGVRTIAVCALSALGVFTLSGYHGVKGIGIPHNVAARFNKHCAKYGKNLDGLVNDAIQNPASVSAGNRFDTEPNSPCCENLMQVIVKTLSGKCITVNVSNTALISDVKKEIEEKVKIPCAQQRLIFAGKLLVDTNTLADYSVQQASTVQLVISLRGGPGYVVYLRIHALYTYTYAYISIHVYNVISSV